jgi:hypothetical protein
VQSIPRALFTTAAALVLLIEAPRLVPTIRAETDLDALMQQVVTKRDDNWKKLQQYVLDEHEQTQLTGPSHRPIWGDTRDYSWYVRDGFFVRSPLKVNGAAVSEADRRKYEEEYLRRMQRREGRDTAALSSADATRDVDTFIRQARQPQFVSAAYFLRFKFEEGKYGLVGHETIDGRDTLRVEYYPTRLFSRPQRWTGHEPSATEQAKAAERERMLNKESLVTLWVEPNARQIVKYTFNNIAVDFLPVSWLVHVNDVHATMTMGQPFPNVWLPQAIDVAVALTIAVGQFDLHYALQYYDYRQADVTTTITIPGAR